MTLRREAHALALSIQRRPVHPPFVAPQENPGRVAIRVRDVSAPVTPEHRLALAVLRRAVLADRAGLRAVRGSLLDQLPHDRDGNAAQNILAAGHAVRAGSDPRRWPVEGLSDAPGSARSAAPVKQELVA